LKSQYFYPHHVSQTLSTSVEFVLLDLLHGGQLHANMALHSASDTSDEHPKITSRTIKEEQYILQAGWKALFGFTTKKHLPILFGAVLSAAIAAATLPAFSIIYGLIFRAYTEYGTGNLDSEALRSSVTRYCLILTSIASLNWIVNSFYFFFFLTFGELQARGARNRVFDALIRKDMTWYDTRETSVAALLPTVQL
jgi:ATP-binding cassette subfamily B (MDR/TAP) protein 1